MSMTDQIPVQTRRAAALLPETPRYVGMVNVETALKHLDDLNDKNLADSLRQTDNPYLRTFLEATGLDPATDVQAAYGALEGGDALSGVLFATLTPAQLTRYLERAPDGAGRRTTYRDAPLFHLAIGEHAPPHDTLSVAFVGEGTMAVATTADRVTAMVDRHRATEQAGLGANDAYMTLVKRVGHGSTAWLAGRDVVETALQDSAATGTQAAQAGGTPQVSQAGLQRALAEWSDRVLGLSDVSSLGGRAGDQMGRLRQRLREQALSITLTDAALEGEVYLTMRDNASAASVVDVAEGAVAVMRLSGDELDERHRDLLDEIQIDRDGAIVHIRFALDREKVRKKVQAASRDHAIRPGTRAIRHATVATRRLAGITRPGAPVRSTPKSGDATDGPVHLSTPDAPYTVGR
jgi:hypothetical protein